MRIHFLGATRTTTGSMYLIEINGKRLLLECGLFRATATKPPSAIVIFPSTRGRLTRLCSSHAHIDHAGNLPNLVKQGYPGPIHCTTATRDLVRHHAD